MQEHTQSTTLGPGVIDINEYEYMGQNLYLHDNHWIITGTEKKFRTCLEAERYIRNVLNKAKQQETGAYTINVEFPKGTKERLQVLNLHKTDADFIRDIVLEKLEQLEKIML